MLDKKKFIEVLGESRIIASVESDAFLVIALIEIREAIDRYIEQRITSDKVREGILKDIYNSIQEAGSQN